MHRDRLVSRLFVRRDAAALGAPQPAEARLQVVDEEADAGEHEEEDDDDDGDDDVPLDHGGGGSGVSI